MKLLLYKCRLLLYVLAVLIPILLVGIIVYEFRPGSTQDAVEKGVINTAIHEQCVTVMAQGVHDCIGKARDEHGVYSNNIKWRLAEVSGTRATGEKFEFLVIVYLSGDNSILDIIVGDDPRDLAQGQPPSG